jgi:hypothetical protein
MGWVIFEDVLIVVVVICVHPREFPFVIDNAGAVLEDIIFLGRV